MRCDRGINSIPEQNIYLYCFCWASPGGSAVKNLSAMQELQEMQGFSTWVRKIPWRRKWQPTPVFLLRESYGQRGLEGLQSMGSQRVGHDWSNVAFFLPALMEINYSYFLNRSDFFFFLDFFLFHILLNYLKNKYINVISICSLKSSLDGSIISRIGENFPPRTAPCQGWWFSTWSFLHQKPYIVWESSIQLIL